MYNTTEGNAKGAKGRSVVRSLRSQAHIEVLPEDDWEAVAAHELKRLMVEASAYQVQLSGRAGEKELAHAISALRATIDAISGETQLAATRAAS